MNHHGAKKTSTIKKLAIIAAIFILLAAIASITVFIEFQARYVAPWKKFRTVQVLAVPLLDRLNEQTFQELPPIPTGYRALRTVAYGILNNPYYIGRGMTVSFSESLTAPSRDKLNEYYDTMVKNAGWQPDYVYGDYRQDERYVYYHKGTSCIELSSNPSGSFIIIWQDIKSQPFVHDIPGDSVISLALIDEWQFATCPFPLRRDSYLYPTPEH